MITSAKHFVKLRSSENPEEYQLAATSEAPLAVWQEVIRDYPDYHEWVAHNKTVPSEILEILAKSTDPNVRHMVAMKRKISENIQLLLAKDSDEAVRNRIANNPKTTKRVLEILKEDPWGEIRKIATERLIK